MCRTAHGEVGIIEFGLKPQNECNNVNTLDYWNFLDTFNANVGKKSQSEIPHLQVETQVNFDVMRSINSRFTCFTYLLTYLEGSGWLHAKLDQRCKTFVENSAAEYKWINTAAISQR